MICPNCNSFVEDGNTFCTTCGQPLQAQGNYQGMQYGDGGAQQGYTQQQDPYAQTNGYGQPQQGYGQPQQNAYGQPQQNVYGQPQQNAYQPQQNAYGQPQQNAYGQPQLDPYGQPQQQNPYMPQGTQMNGYPAPTQGGGIPSFVTAPDGRQVGMNWFKFIIWVQLFLSALIAVYNGIMLLTGSHYKQGGTDYKEMVYSMFDGLKGCDTAFGILYLCLAGTAIFTRFQLSGFKKKGPAIYIAYLVGALAVAIFYIIVVGGILSKYGASASDIVTPSIVAQIVTSIVLIFVNILYFKNRKHLFVN